MNFYLRYREILQRQGIKKISKTTKASPNYMYFKRLFLKLALKMQVLEIFSSALHTIWGHIKIVFNFEGQARNTKVHIK
jgi:hypothetical protein